MESEEFKKILENVSDSYEDFVIGTMLAAKTDEDRNKIINFINSTPNVDTSQIIEYLSDEINHIPKYF